MKNGFKAVAHVNENQIFNVSTIAKMTFQNKNREIEFY